MREAAPTPDPAPKKPVSARKRLRRAQNKLIEHQATLLEGLFDDGSFGGTDAFYRHHIERDGEDGRWVPLSVPSDRRHGGNWPLWRTEAELDFLRQQARVAAESNSFAIGVIANVVNFTIGDGCSYKCTPKKGLALVGAKPPDEVVQVVAQTQDVVDKFLALNHFNGTVDPNGSMQIEGSKEREIVRTTEVDGECILRFHGMDDGRTFVRPQGGEQLRNPPGGIESEGWSYGIRHNMYPFEDVCDPQEYHLAYNDVSTGQRSRQAHEEPVSPMGELVPADEIMHLKGRDTNSRVKRGTPKLSGDALSAFLRASKLQNALSMGATIRACTAEIWQAKTATQAQMQGLASSLGVPTRSGPHGGRPGLRSRMEPGTVRYIGDGLELANHTDDQTASYVQGVQSDLRQAINIFCAPEFFTGDASGADYSSTKEAGSPWSQNAKALQGYYRAAFLRAVWWAIRHAVRRGVLDRRALEWVTVQVEAPAVVYRDEFQRAQTDQILVGMGVKDPQTCSMERGLDPEMVEMNLAQAKKAQGGPGAPGGGDQQPPGGGQEQPPPAPGGGQDQQQQPPQAPPGDDEQGKGNPLAALGLSESFTGIAPNGHHYVNGKQVTIEKKPADVPTPPAEKAPWEQTQKEYDKPLKLKYPKAGEEVDGRKVVNRNKVDNLGSISSSVDDYDTLPGIREVKTADFAAWRGLDNEARAADDKRRVTALAEKIKQSGKISPLIVVHDDKGPYILEGAHRYDALQLLGARSFPAVVVIDRSNIYRHREAVEAALADGTHVPPEVLADYPDLKKPIRESRRDPLAALGLSEALVTPTGTPVGHTGELKNKLGHRYCLNKGKRVPCAPLAKGGGADKERAAVPEGEHHTEKVPATVANLHAEVLALTAARGKLEAADYHKGLQALAERIGTMKLAEIRDLAGKLETGAKDRGKAGLTAKIVEHFKGAPSGAAPAPKPAKPGHGGDSAKARAKKLAGETDERARSGRDGAGSQRPRAAPPGDSGPVAASPDRSDAEGADKGGDAGDKSAGAGAPARIPAKVEEVNKRLGKFEKFFRDRGQGHVSDWLGKVRDHVAAVGTDEALASLRDDTDGGHRGPVQYEGASTINPLFTSMGNFAEHYLIRNGIIPMNLGGASNELPLVASNTNKGAFEGRPGDFGGVDYLPEGITYKDKLEESKIIPGLESSEDLGVIMGKDVSNITDDVVAALDAKYANGWVIKAYHQGVSSGFGVYFAKRCEQIRADARNLIWSAGEQIGRHGFELNRDDAGRITGVKHEGGDVYDFGTDRFNDTIGGEVREWCDRLTAKNELRVAVVAGGDLGEDKQDVAGSAIDNEHGSALPELSKRGEKTQYMVQPAFKAVGVSDADRQAGRTIAPGEARLHVTTRDGRVTVIPYTTWIKGAPLPVVFDDENTRAMTAAVESLLSQMPEEHRSGQMYAPDVLKTEDGYKVVELNAIKAKGGSGYLRNNPFIIDAYVSHAVGREPAHAQFIRRLLTDRAKKEGTEDDAATSNRRRRAESRERGPEKLPGHDARAKARIDPTQPDAGSSPETGQALLKHFNVHNLPEAPAGSQGRWDQPESVRVTHNGDVLRAAMRAGMLIPPEKLSRVTASPNVGGQEHDVHEDADHNRFFKLTKGGHFGQNKDIGEYLKRHEIANKLWPALGYKFHGITQDNAGNPQAVMSMNRIEGTHPEYSEIDNWFEGNGWEHSGDHAWRDPQSGTTIGDASPANFIKAAGGLVPIDVDILPGKGAP